MQATTLEISLLESLPEPHCVFTHSDLRCVAVNSAFAALIGRNAADMPGLDVRDFWPEVGRQRAESPEESAEFRDQRGEAVIVKVAIYRGGTAGAVSVLRVLASVSREAVTQVFHTQRLETLGVLAGAIAHDFNNILTGILGHVAYLQSVLPTPGMHTEAVAAIEEGALRGAGLTQQILTFSRLEAGEQFARVDLPGLVSRVCLLLKGAIPSSVELQWEPPTTAVAVLATEAYLSQVLINLLVNARDAITGGGRLGADPTASPALGANAAGKITVQCEPHCAGPDVKRLFGAEPAASGYCALVVRDTGAGMDDEVKARLFEPYFTTKKQGGTGLGLTTVCSIVKRLGGAIDLTSQLGAGSEFRIVLPRLQEESATLAASQVEALTHEPAPFPRGGGERILVVDDEYAVRNVIGLSLTHLGYTVETAASGLEAINKFSIVGKSFDLVVMDMLMPGLSGEEVFSRLRLLQPDLKVLIVSGFSSEQAVNRVLSRGGLDFIQKPFSIEVLATKVRQCIDGQTRERSAAIR
jgi:two-component system cell cycle sensor histidine kinase/response regulator CckA